MRFTLAASLVLCAFGSAQQADSVDWSAVAKKKRHGVFGIVAPCVGGRPERYALGFFVSKDGWAITSLSALSQRDCKLIFQFPDGEKLPTPNIRHVDPEHAIAILQFDYSPPDWFELSEKPMILGETVAVVDVHRDKPCAVGPLLAKAKIASFIMRKPLLETVWSIGSGIAVGGQCMTSLPVINQSGALRGYYHSEIISGNGQVLIYASSAAHLIPALNLARKEKKSIPLPLPEELDLFDPAMQESDYLQARASMLRGDYDNAIERINNALKKYPDSCLLHHYNFLAHQISKAHELPNLLAPTKPPSGGNAALQLQYLKNLVIVRMIQKDQNGVAHAAQEALEMDPDSGDLNLQYAEALQKLGKKDEALRYYSKAAEVSPDDIGILDRYSSMLAREGKWKEADALNARIHDLEELYRRK